jgi:hypothetical protein
VTGPPSVPPWFASLAAFLVVPALVGCSSTENKTEACPRIAVLSEAGSLTRYVRSSGTDILDIDFQGEITDLVARCEYPGKKGPRRVVVQLAPVFVLGRGAANTDHKADFTYFVSVVRNEEILSKQLFEVSSEFPDNRSRLVLRDDDPPIAVDIPLADRAAEYAYEVLVGFQLTPEELQRNQASRGSGR